MGLGAPCLGVSYLDNCKSSCCPVYVFFQHSELHIWHEAENGLPVHQYLYPEYGLTGGRGAHYCLWGSRIAPSLSLSQSCVALGRLLSFSELWVILYLHNRINNAKLQGLFGGLNEPMFAKCLAANDTMPAQTIATLVMKRIFSWSALK